MWSALLHTVRGKTFTNVPLHPTRLLILINDDSLYYPIQAA